MDQTNWSGLVPQDAAADALPDLRNVGLVAIDLETRDDSLRADKGPGWPTKAGYICSSSVAWHREGNEIRSLYIPLCHPDSANYDREQVFRWLRDHITAGVRFVTQNGLYDWGWLSSEAGISMPAGAQLEEIGALAAQHNENLFRYDLDSLCKQYGLEGKSTDELNRPCSASSAPIGASTVFRPISGNCRRGWSSLTPGRMLSRRCGCSKSCTRRSSPKAPRKPIGSTSTCCR
jgi:hypothetical protein